MLQASLTAAMYIFCDPTTQDLSLADPEPSDIAAQRYTETLFAAGDAIAYHADASAAAATEGTSSEKAWKAESAKLKAVAAAQNAITAALGAVEAAAEVTKSVHAKAWRGELKEAKRKVAAAAWPGIRTKDEKGDSAARKAVQAAGDAADAARDAIDVARRAATEAADHARKAESSKESLKQIPSTDDQEKGI
jgi:hypothetical protein